MAYTTIDDPTQFFNTLLYTGNAADGSSTTQDITGVGFQPDWVWLKSRTEANHHFLVDSVRGANKGLYSDLTNSENTSTNYLKSFASDGFQVGPDGVVNANSQSYVSWNWLAGGSTSSNSDGDITTTVSANTTAGFSIVSYTGTGTAGDSGTHTIGHGLGSAPKWVIIKQRNSARNWSVGHDSLTWLKYIYLDVTNASAGGSANNFWGDTAPSSSVITLIKDSGVNATGNTYIAYCFTPIKGYLKFGSYPGNGNADGPFIHTGFKPAWLMIKGFAGTDDWIMMDNKRSGFNSENEYLDANNSSTESDGSGNIDFLSNGFKIKSTFSSLNYSTGEYIYMAFAESPFVNSSGIPCNAR